jgi:exosortase E/protease (VPEID-CTERM system)
MTTPHSIAAAGSPETSGSLLRRLTFAGLVLALECVVVAALKHPWLQTMHIATAPIAFLVALAFFGRKQLSIGQADEPVSKPFLALHTAALVLMLALHFAMLRAFAAGNAVPLAEPLAWCLALIVMAGSMLCAIIPPANLVGLARSLGKSWIYAAITASAAVAARQLEYLAWDAPESPFGQRLASGAFAGVKAILIHLYPTLEVDPAARILGVGNFRIHVAGACSGIEGLALTLFLTIGWIVIERRHLRLARAIWLVPAALVLTWCLNIVRIVLLVIIGATGHPTVAITGFHTEAGWIAFAAVAIAFLLAANQIAWFHSDAATSSVAITDDVPAETTAVTYLLPFIAILGTSLFTKAATSGFEHLYPLRLLVVLAIFFAFRKRYAAMRWAFTPTDLAIGVGVGLVWLYAAHLANPHPDNTQIAEGLAAMSPLARTFWLATRVFAAVITVPIAEELAFRGFLARRIVGANVERVRYASLTILSIVISSVAFGFMHGNLWFVGILSGVAFAYAARRTNSLGSAIAAHASANLVLAAWVFATANYSLW